MKRFEPGKAIATLRHKLDKAAHRCAALARRYTDQTSRIYFDPRFWDNTTAVLTVAPQSECDFVTNYGRENLFVMTFDNGYGYREFRTISERKFAQLQEIENQLLDAWEKESVIAWQLRELTKTFPTLFAQNVA